MTRSLVLSALALVVRAAIAQDQCSSAIPITAGVWAVDTINGTEIPTPLCANTGNTNVTGGEWYTYTPSADLSLTITTELPTNAARDTRFHVYSGSCGALACVGGDDDSGVLGTGYLSIDVVPVTAGITYTIAFDDRWETNGFVFELIENAPPPAPPVAFTPSFITTVGNTFAVVDMNNDQLDDVVSVGTSNININFQQPGGGFAATNFATTPADFLASWSLAAGDIDGNGFNDLIYGGGGGVTFMKANDDGTAYTEISFPQYVFSQRSNFVDINNDGHLDAFMCHDVDPNVYYLNDGTGNLVYHQGGLGDVADGGNYGSIWIDYDGDHDVDLFIAKCRGGQVVPAIDELHRNNGDGTFTNVSAEMGFADYHQSWSGAWADFDRDGDMDVMVGASSFSQGGHKLMRNDGNIFTNVTVGSGFDAFSGTSIEHVAHDFNNDGWVDVMSGPNILQNNGNMTFSPIPVDANSGGIGDLNGDGFLDVQNNSTSWLNDGNDNNWIRINTVGTVSNRNGIGARVEVTSALGTQIRDVKSGDGFRYMGSLMAHFGLGADTAVTSITVYWPSGIVNVIEHPSINGVVTITEEVNTAVNAPRPVAHLVLFPVPVENVLYVSSNKSVRDQTIHIVDITGKRVLDGSLLQGHVDVSSLNSGVYVMQAVIDGEPMQQKFVKR
jgi:ASPIC and UnbV/FG-GAP-like repeat/Secretion system C-terminal sorting domain